MCITCHVAVKSIINYKLPAESHFIKDSREVALRERIILEFILARRRGNAISLPVTFEIRIARGYVPRGYVTRDIGRFDVLGP